MHIMIQSCQRILAIFCLFSIGLSFFACKKEGPMLTLKNPSAAGGSLMANTDKVTLTPVADNDTVLTFHWPAADYGEKVVVTYTLQVDLPADTAGPAGWANAKSFAAGSNTLSFFFVGKDLNNLAIGMGLANGVANSLAIRLKTAIPQYNGSASSVPVLYSNTVMVSVNPYALNLYVPGGYEGWNPAAAPVISPVDGRPGLYEGYVNITGGGIQYFKYTNAPDWNHTNYGDGGNGTFSTDGNAAGLSVPAAGYYELTADLNKNTWTATATTWGIIGDATPGGWNTDTDMSYDPATGIWKVTANMIKNGSFKFRANHAWTIDFGIDNSGKLVYADNPFFGYTPNLNNLAVPSDGNYTIVLDLHVSGKYTYQLIKN